MHHGAEWGLAWQPLLATPNTTCPLNPVSHGMPDEKWGLGFNMRLLPQSAPLRIKVLTGSLLGNLNSATIIRAPQYSLYAHIVLA